MRGISDKFINDLISDTGELVAIHKKIQSNNNLCICIRDGYINIYYGGGNALKITEQKRNYKLEFDEKYCINGVDDGMIQKIRDLETISDYVASFDLILKIMDHWFNRYPKPEREVQQELLLRNKNIIDIEYQVKNKSRYDMIMTNQDKLVIVENKFGTGSISGKAGLFKHYNDIQDLIDNHKDELIRSMENIIRAKQALGISCDTMANQINEIEILFLCIDYKPQSDRLKNEVDKIRECKKHAAKILFLAEGDYNIDFSKATDIFSESLYS